MNIIIKRDDSQPARKNWFPYGKLYFFVTVVVPVVALWVTLMWVFWYVSKQQVPVDIAQEPSIPVHTAPQAVDPIEVVVTSVAESYGVPAAAMIRFSQYLQQDNFDGVGLFSIKPEHIGWIQGSVLLNTDIDLEDDVQNTQIAAFLIRRFMDSGYSVEEAFLIYVWGFPAVHERDRHQDFLDMVFPDGG